MKHVPRQVMFWAIKLFLTHLKGSKVYKVYFRNITGTKLEISNRKLSGGMHMFIILIVVVVSQAYTCIKTHQSVHFEYVQFIVCHFHRKKLLQKNMTSLKCKSKDAFLLLKRLQGFLVIWDHGTAGEYHGLILYAPLSYFLHLLSFHTPCL